MVASYKELAAFGATKGVELLVENFGWMQADPNSVVNFIAAIDRDLLEIPAGKRDVPGEPPAETAARELREEVGLVAGSLTPLTEFFNTPGFSDEYSYAFLATDCTEVEMERQGAEEQHMDVVRLPLTDAVAQIASGTIDDAKTIIGILLAQLRLSSG